jgi:lysine-specific permease
MGPHIDWYGALVAYIGLPLFFILWFGYKFIKKTKIVPLDKCDLSN